MKIFVVNLRRCGGGAVQQGEVLLQLGQGVPGEAQLGDNVLRQAGLHPVHTTRLNKNIKPLDEKYLEPNSHLALRSLQQLIELLGVELETLEQPRRPRHRQQQRLDQARQVGRSLRRLVAGLEIF